MKLPAKIVIAVVILAGISVSAYFVYNKFFNVESMVNDKVNEVVGDMPIALSQSKVNYEPIKFGNFDAIEKRMEERFAALEAKINSIGQ
jgi:hypothetical protein